MARNYNGLRNAGGNRTDIPGPKVKQAGQPNGRPVAADLPDHLPYGEKGALQQAIAATPKPRSAAPRGRPLPPPATAEDFTKGPGNDRLRQIMANRPPRQPVPGLMDPVGADEPAGHPMSGAIGQPDSVLGQPQPGGVGPMLAQIAAMTGSQALAALATRAQANGV